MSFLLFINFLFLISPWPYLCIFIYIIVVVVRILNSLDCWSFKSLNHGLNHSKVYTARQFCDFQCFLFLFRQSVWTGTLFDVELFFVFCTESVMLGPRFIPESVFYTQSVMISPRFIPEPVFYTQSVVRSPQSIFYTDRSWNRPFAGSGHMVQNKLHWDANDAVRLSKQRKVGLDW